jgi:flagellar protein FlgJ
MSIIPPRQTRRPTGGNVPISLLQQALTKVSPQAQAKAKSQAQDFEAVFLNSMFSQMTSGIKGDGPFGNTPGTGIWRSMMTEQYSKSFARPAASASRATSIAPSSFNRPTAQPEEAMSGKRWRWKPKKAKCHGSMSRRFRN